MEPEEVGEILKEYFVPVLTNKEELEESEISVENANVQAQCEVKEEEVLPLLKGMKVKHSETRDMLTFYQVKLCYKAC